jgi:hypothetical protein
MKFCIGDHSDKHWCSRRVDYDRGAALSFDDKDLAKDFAEFADIMSVLLTRRPAAREFGRLSHDQSGRCQRQYALPVLAVLN